MKISKEIRSFAGNAAVRDAFLLRRFFYLSLTHAPIFHRSMRVLWMQRNIRCIAAATFKMIAMSFARSASNQNKPEWQRPSLSHLLWASILRHIPPLASPPPLNPLLILLMSERHQCLHIGHQVWMTLTVEPPDTQMRRKVLHPPSPYPHHLDCCFNFVLRIKKSNQLPL